MIDKWWNKLDHNFPDIKLHDYIIMPNHIHGIIQIKSVGAVPPTKGVCPGKSPQPEHFRSDNRILNGHIPGGPESGKHTLDEDNNQGGHTGPPLHVAVQWFKTMTTNDYIQGVNKNEWILFNKQLWQRNYYEHIIRDEKSYIQIAEYIKNNPRKWQDDQYYK